MLLVKRPLEIQGNVSALSFGFIRRQGVAGSQVLIWVHSSGKLILQFLKP